MEQLFTQFKVGDTVLIKRAAHTPELVGQKRKIVRVTEKRVYVESHPKGWNHTLSNINEYLEVTEPAAPSMDDTRSYLATITELQNVRAG